MIKFLTICLLAIVVSVAQAQTSLSFNKEFIPSKKDISYVLDSVKVRRCYFLEVQQDTVVKWVAGWCKTQSGFKASYSLYPENDNKDIFYNDRKTKVTNKILQLIIK